MTDTDTKRVDELRAKKEALHAELQKISEDISSAINELKERREQRNVLTAKAQEQKQVRKELSAVIKDQIRAVKELRSSRGPRQQAPDPKQGGESPRILKETIVRLERKLETSAMDFSQEQKLTKILKEKKAALAKIASHTDLDKEIRTLSKQIDKLKKQSDDAHELVTVSAKESQQHHERILELSKFIEDLKAKEIAIKEQFVATKEELSRFSPAQELPSKRARKKPTQKAEPSAEDEAVLKEKAAKVEEKVKSKQKLTTEDLLAFQSQKD